MEYPSRLFARVGAVSMGVLLMGLIITFVVADIFAGAVVCGVLLVPAALATVWVLRYRVRLLPNAIEEHTLFGTKRIAFTQR